MEPIERLLTVIEHKQPDHLPWVPLAFGGVHQLTDHTLYDYLHQAKIMCLGQEMAQHRLGSDALFVYGDNALEAEALGCGIDYSRPVYPYVSKPLFLNWLPGDTLPALRTACAGRLPQMLEACNLLKRRNSGLAVIAHVTGPVTLAAQLMGVDNFLYFAADFPERIPSLLLAARQVGEEYMKALLEAGADGIIVGDPCASPAFLPAAYYPLWVLPEHRSLMHMLAQAGCAIRWLLITGNTARILGSLGRTGANVLTVDYMVSLPVARQEVDLVVAGNLKPHLFALDSPDSLRQETNKILEWETGGINNFWLSTGCEIPLETNWRVFPESLFKEIFNRV